MSDAVDVNKSANFRKPPRQGSSKALAGINLSEQSHVFLVALVALSVFCCEILLMSISFLLPLPNWLIAILDAMVLIILLSPVLYLFMFRPLVRELQERNRAEAIMRESETRYRTLFFTNPDAITVSRLEDGQILDANEGFRKLSGYSPDEVLGKSSLDISLWNDATDRQKFVADLQLHGHVENFEVRFRHKNGRVGTGLISARTITLGGQTHIMAVIRDVTQWEITQKRLRATLQFLGIANRHDQMEPLLEAFVWQIKKLADCTAVGLRILDENGNIPYLVQDGFSRGFQDAENPLSINAARCLCAQVIMDQSLSRHPFMTEAGSFCVGSTTDFLSTLSEVEKNRLCDVCNRYGYESVALIPIRLGNQILGLIHVADFLKQAFSGETIATLEAAALQLGPAIERVGVKVALQKSHRELERRVAERTFQLASANERLNIEIEERKSNEQQLLNHQDKLRSLSSALLMTEERERRHIANELHDRIGQFLSVSKIKLDELLAGSPSTKMAEALASVLGLIEQAIEDTRSLTFELSPPVLYELGLEAALAWLADQMREKHALRVDVKDDNRSKLLDGSSRVIAFQAVRELLFNIVKHAHAKRATISIRREADAVCIDIEDDGVGFDPSALGETAAASKSFGLFSIQERIGPLGGRMEIHSGAGRGTRVSLVLPIACAKEDSGG